LNARGCVDSFVRLLPPLDVLVTLFFTNLVLLFTFLSTTLALVRALHLLEFLPIEMLFRKGFCFFFPMLSSFFLFTALGCVWLWFPGQSCLDGNMVGSTGL
jgi:hypothetical protein